MAAGSIVGRKTEKSAGNKTGNETGQGRNATGTMMGRGLP